MFRIRITLLVLVCSVPVIARGESLPIFIDGEFDDWTGTVEYVDASGDAGSSGIDFLEVDVANDEEYLFVRFQVTTLVSIQDGANPLILYLDTDNNAATGVFINGIGAELEWQFGQRDGTFHVSGSSIFQNDIRLRQLPSVTSPEFEVAIGRNVQPDGSNPLFTGDTIRVLLVDDSGGGDQAPDFGSTLTYVFDTGVVGPPAAIDFNREDSNDTRIVTWNTRDLTSGGQFDNSAAQAADRVLSAMDPDVVCYQEVGDVSASQMESQMESFLPSGPGESWHAAKNSDNIIASRFAILNSWNVSGNLLVLLDADSKLGVDLLLLGAHLPCCTNDSGRQDEADEIMSFFRDAMTPGGTLDVPDGTAFVIAGDLNLVGDSQQLITLLTGDIVDEGSYGPDFNPDWDGSDLADVISSQTEARFAYTWRNDFSSFCPGRLDFLIFNDSVLDRRQHYIVYTPEMSVSELSANNLQANDVTDVSDHLPHLADFRPQVVSDVGPRNDQAGVRLRALDSPARGGVRLLANLEEPATLSVEIYDVTGRHVRTLRRSTDGVLDGGSHVLPWDGKSKTGTTVTSGAYFVRLVAWNRTGSAQVSRKVVFLK